MYYAVLRKDIKIKCRNGVLTLKTGGVYQVAKTHDGAVKYRTIDTLGFGDALDTYGEPYGPWYDMSVTEAREHFTKPMQELNDAIEESFLVCEAAYC